MQPNPLHWVEQFILAVKHYQTACRLARNATNNSRGPDVGFYIWHRSSVGKAHQRVSAIDGDTVLAMISAWSWWVRERLLIVRRLLLTA